MENEFTNLTTLEIPKYDPKKSIETELPPGTYSAQVDSALPYYRDNENYWMIILKLHILAGPYEGQPVTKYYHINTTSACDFFRREFALLDLHVHTPDDLPEACGLAAGRRIALKVQQVGGGMTYYLAKPKVAKSYRLEDPAAVWQKK